MSTSVTNVVSHFPTAQNGFSTTTAGSVASGAATVTLNSVAGYTNGEPAVFVIDPTDATKKQTFTGIIDTSGVQVTSVVWTAGTNTTHSLGATVVDYATATHIAMMSKGIKVGHNQDGTHKASLPLTTPKITTSITDANGNEIIRTPATASAVNDITVTNAATTGTPVIAASGDDTNVGLNLRGKGLAKTVTIGAGAVNIFPYDYVASGCVWTADAAGSTRLASMTAGVVVINGNPLTVAAVTSRTFTASKDVYVDVLDNGDGTGLLVYTDGTTNAASGALASNSIRLAIIVVGAGNIAAAASINQGQEDRVLPIASSIPYTVTDSLGNLICPRDPNRKLLGYRQVTSDQATASGSFVDVTGLNLFANIPTGRKVVGTVYAPNTYNSTSLSGGNFNLLDVTNSTSIVQGSSVSPAANATVLVNAVSKPYTPTTSGFVNFKAQFNLLTSGGFHTNGSTAANVVYLKIELE